MHLNLSPRHFKPIIILLVFLNLFFLGGTWLYDSVGARTGNSTRFLLLQLDLAYENVLSAWYSSMLLLSVAIMCIFCFLIDKERFQRKVDTFINHGWIILSLIFATLSLDELGSFHETIGDTGLFEIFGKSEGWQVFYILIILVGIFMVLFSWIRLRRMPLATAFMVAGVLLLLSNPLQENFEIESMQSSVNPSQWKRPVIYLLLEEGSEIFATICFLVSTMTYYAYSYRHVKSLNVVSSNNNAFHISKIKLLWFTISLVILLGALMAIVDRYIQREVNNEIGIPKNWFPATMTFIVFISSLYFFYNSSKARRSFFLYMAILSILLSAYCGADLYEHHFNELIVAEKIFNWTIIVFVIILGTRFLPEQHGITNKLLVFMWAVCICLAFKLNKSYTSEFILTGFSFFLIAIVGNCAKNNTGNYKKIL